MINIYKCSCCLDSYKPVSTSSVPVQRDCKSKETDQQEPDCNIKKIIVDLVENLENKIKGLHCLAETIGKTAYQGIYQNGVNITK